MTGPRLARVAPLVGLTLSPAGTFAAILGWRPTLRLTRDGMRGLRAKGGVVWAGGAGSGLYPGRDGGLARHIDERALVSLMVGGVRHFPLS